MRFYLCCYVDSISVSSEEQDSSYRCVQEPVSSDRQDINDSRKENVLGISLGKEMSSNTDEAGPTVMVDEDGVGPRCAMPPCCAMPPRCATPLPFSPRKV
ncbi:hypothetical protein Q7C36_003428 [Tachysurus vachellii]|uniref:Uncharacterized protein n=1 Tax=Tachysurus vachellii TaxID=175792 RepID=A0AA88P3Q7_TACVA|nr:hypothetical protein Q7C36_003428 [Tachysurus vachellii]